MANLPKYPDIKETDRAYFAGLFDGEGTVGITKAIKKNKNIGYGLRISFKITYESVLLRMQKFFGGNIYVIDKDKQKNYNSSKSRIEYSNAHPDDWKQQYMFTLSGRNALYFLKIIEPFCDEKKQQVSLGIRYEEGRRNNYTRSEHETERCEFFYQELRRLKKEQKKEDETEYEYDFEDDQKNLFSFVEEV